MKLRFFQKKKSKHKPFIKYSGAFFGFVVEQNWRLEPRKVFLNKPSRQLRHHNTVCLLAQDPIKVNSSVD